MRGARATAAAAVALTMLAGCGRDNTPPAATPSTPAAPMPGSPGGGPAAAGAGDPEKGRQVYLGQCVACHNSDPTKDGPVGPALKGSRPDLVEARVLRAAYPPGYKPKRNTRAMPARPDLAASVPDLIAYLR